MDVTPPAVIAAVGHWDFRAEPGDRAADVNALWESRRFEGRGDDAGRDSGREGGGDSAIVRPR